MKKKRRKLSQIKCLRPFILVLFKNNPIFFMVLGLCSALAVTNRVANSLAMGAGVTFVIALTSTFIAALRNLIPVRVRMITYMITIASLVIIVDRIFQAYVPEISKAMGPYVGLIITNCIVMGRAEAFAIKNKIIPSLLDGLGSGLGYSYALIIIGIIREILAFGTVLGYKITPNNWTQWVLMGMAPGAFFLLGIYVWIMRTLAKIKETHREP